MWTKSVIGVSSDVLGQVLFIRFVLLCYEEELITATMTALPNWP